MRNLLSTIMCCPLCLLCLIPCLVAFKMFHWSLALSNLVMTCLCVICFMVLVHEIQWALRYELLAFENFWTIFFQILFLTTPPPGLWKPSHIRSEALESGWWKLVPFPAVCEHQALLLPSFRAILSLVPGSSLTCRYLHYNTSHKHWAPL